MAALPVAALLADQASAMPVDLAGRDGNGMLQFRAAELSTGVVPSVITPPRGFGGTLSPVVLAPAPLPPAPLAVGPIFAQVRTVSSGSQAGQVVVGASIQPSPPLPSLVSHAVDVSDPGTSSSSIAYGGVAIPSALGRVTAPPQQTVVVVTIDGTIDPNSPQTPPVANPLPGAVWMFATGLGLLPFLRRRCRKR